MSNQITKYGLFFFFFLDGMTTIQNMKAPPDICDASQMNSVARRSNRKTFNLSFLEFDFPCEQFFEHTENDSNACVTNLLFICQMGK